MIFKGRVIITLWVQNYFNYYLSLCSKFAVKDPFGGDFEGFSVSIIGRLSFSKDQIEPVDSKRIMKGGKEGKGQILDKGGGGIVSASFKLPSVQWHVPFFSFYQRAFMLLAVVFF